MHPVKFVLVHLFNDIIYVRYFSLIYFIYKYSTQELYFIYEFMSQLKIRLCVLYIKFRNVNVSKMDRQEFWNCNSILLIDMRSCVIKQNINILHRSCKNRLIVLDSRFAI